MDFTERLNHEITQINTEKYFLKKSCENLACPVTRQRRWYGMKICLPRRLNVQPY